MSVGAVQSSAKWQGLVGTVLHVRSAAPHIPAMSRMSRGNIAGE